MKILVTGGSGFLGSHCTAALVRHGHQIRLLARSPAKAARALAPLGNPTVEVIQGDVTRSDDVKRALTGCQAVLHSANIYSTDSRRYEEMTRTNSTSTQIVLDLAREEKCDPIVHVSTVAVLYPAKTPIPADPPLGTGLPSGYVQSKLAAETIARERQALGFPIVTTYPGTIWGPHDPGPGEMVHLLHGLLGNRFCFRFPKRAGFPIADINWLAEAHAALYYPGLGPRRLTMSGHYVYWSSLFDTLRQIVGRHLPLILPSPERATFALASLLTQLQRGLPWRLPFAIENVWSAFNSAPTDDKLAFELAGPPPPLEETLAAAIKWAIEANYLPRKWGGRLLLDSTEPSR
jgi:dihydroflavonol-4-reductase